MHHRSCVSALLQCSDRLSQYASQSLRAIVDQLAVARAGGKGSANASDIEAARYKEKTLTLLLEQLHGAIQRRGQKAPVINWLSAELCAELGALRVISCKSAKDRTGGLGWGRVVGKGWREIVWRVWREGGKGVALQSS